MKCMTKDGLLAVALGLLLAGAAATQAAAPDKYMPDNTEMVMFVDVKALLASGVVKKHAEKEMNDLFEQPQVAEILRALGLEPRKDINSVTICVSKVEIDVGGGRPDGKAEALILVRGAYKPDQIHKTLAEGIKGDPNKLSSSEYSGMKVYEGKGQGADQTGYFAILDNSTIAVSNKKSQVTDAIDRHKGKSSSKLGKEIAAMVEKADGKRTIWMAMVLPGAVKDLAKLASQGGEIIEAIEGVTMGTSVADGVRLELSVHTNNEGVANQIRQGVEAGKGLIAVQLLQNKDVGPLVQPVVNSIKVEANSGKSVKITAEADAATIEKLVKKAKER
jgi:hypothetical protein